MFSTIIAGVLVYLVIGIIIAEITEYVQRKHHITGEAGVYIKLVMLWPVIIYISSKRW